MSMPEAFIGEVYIFAGEFAPRGFAFCDGQLLLIAQNTALFSILGTTYGGDGRTTVGLPNLEGRAPMHPGRGPGLTSRRLGEKVGAETATLNLNQMASHTHNMKGLGPANTNTPTGATAATNPTVFQYAPMGNLVDAAATAVTATGSGGAHNNVQPFLTLNFVIALDGQYPSRS
jgi:microcystin-dependent protein